MVKNHLQCRILGSSPMLGRSLGGGNSNPLQYSCLENFMNRGAWWATVHVVTNNWTRLSNWSQTHTHTYSWSKYMFTIYISINSVLLVSDMLVLTMFWALETQDLQENLFHFSKADAKFGVIFYSNVVILPAVWNCLLSEYRILKLILN